jgi:propionyl-CoA synthetase
VALYWSMKNLYGVEPGEVWWCASDVGWVVGHSYIAYGPLIYGATSILYEGKPVGTPDAGAFWRVISEHRAVALFTAPTAFRAIKREDPEGKLLQKYDLSKFRTLFLAGERGDPPTIQWAQTMLGVPIVDHWWQTETGWSICGNFQGLDPMPIKPGSCSVPAPGWHLEVLDENGHPMERGQVGAIAAKLPLPPGTFPTLWNADERYKQGYLTEFPGYYKSGDAGFIDEDGYVSVMTRVDDVINVAGHRLSTGQIEEVLGAHDDVAECAVIGVADELKGQVPLGFVVLKAGVDRPDQEIAGEIVQMVRDRIGPVAFFKSALVVQRLPKTRSGKILRGTIQKMADNQPWTMPATIEDPVVLDEIKDGLKAAGYAAKG